MIVNLKGTIQLDNCIPDGKLLIQQAVINSKINATVREDVIYIDSDIDDRYKFIDSFSWLLAMHLPLGHQEITFNVTDGTIENTYDIIINKNKLYRRYYQLVSCEIEPYLGFEN